MYKTILELNDDEVLAAIKSSKEACRELLKGGGNLNVKVPHSLIHLGLSCHLSACLREPTAMLIDPQDLLPSFLVFFMVGVSLGRTQAEKVTLKDMVKK